MLDHENRRTLDAIVEASALNAKGIPEPIRDTIDAAVSGSRAVIARSGVQT